MHKILCAYTYFEFSYTEYCPVIEPSWAINFIIIININIIIIMKP